VTVLEAIQKSTDFLAKKQVESPRLQTELLLAHLLKMPRMKLYLNFDRKLSVVEIDALRDAVRRRGQREPLQHITGSTSFCGHEIVVNRDVLIPRPETELLAELGWSFLQQLPDSAGRKNLSVLDLCTGSGCIAIAIAAKCPAAALLAVDISPAALAVARLNAERNQLPDRIKFLEGDGFKALVGSPEQGATLRFDLIVSNPPYIPSAEIATLDPEVRDFDPALALDGGADGLDFYRRLAAEGAAHLKPEGRLMLEFGDGQAEEIKKIMEKENWIVEAVKEDYSQRARILIIKISPPSSGPA
jgi:release factor glutamine methyltransferase